MPSAERCYFLVSWPLSVPTSPVRPQKGRRGGALSTLDRDVPLPCGGLTFHNTPGPDKGSLSLIGYTYEDSILVTPGSLALQPSLQR
jgi:hypothetical protein